MVNFDNYTVSIMWGQYKISQDGSSATQLTWCWHAIATHTRFTTPVPTVPTGWIDTESDNGISESIECYSTTWSDLITKLSALSTFWG